MLREKRIVLLAGSSEEVATQGTPATQAQFATQTNTSVLRRPGGASTSKSALPSLTAYLLAHARGCIGSRLVESLDVIVEQSERMLRKAWKIAWRGCLAVVALAALIYGAEDVYARMRGRPTEQIKVDQYYTEVNRYNELEYSAGSEVLQTCVDALMPHFGYKPCWYLKRHTLEHKGTE